MSLKLNIINTNYIDEISLKLEFKKKVFSLFKQNVFDFDIEMKQALNNKQYEDLGEVVHKAKSSVKIIGMDKQSDDMKLLESDVKKNINTETYEKRIMEFINSCHAALEEISLLEKELGI